MEGAGLILRVWTKWRPWWGFGLIQRWQEFEMEPPPGTSPEKVKEMADQIRATGAGCRIEGWDRAA